MFESSKILTEPEDIQASLSESENFISIGENGAQLVSNFSDAHILLWKQGYGNSYLQYPYYQLVHNTLDHQFEHYFLVFQTKKSKKYVQPMFLVEQNICEGLSPNIKKILTKYLPHKLLNTKILMIGCSTGEGVLFASHGDHEAVLILQQTTRQVAQQLGAALIVFKDFPASYRPILQSLSIQHGYVRVPSFPACAIELAPYRGFTDYMKQTLSRKTRKDLYRKFRKAERLGGFSMEVIDDFTPVVDEIYPLYRQVIERSNFKFEVLTRDYFIGLRAALEDKGRFFIWRDSEGKIIAFNLCMLDGKRLRDCYIGLDYRVALDAHLYFISFRDVLSWAIENGIEQYYSSPLNYSAKLHLKLKLVPLDLYIQHTNSVINFFFKRLLPLLEPTRYDLILPKFPNYTDLR